MSEAMGDDGDRLDGDGLTRRRLLGTAAAAGAAAALPSVAADAASGQLIDAFAAAEDANVVVVVIDSLRSDHVGAYGGRRAHTPTLDALAGEGLTITRARHETMPTVPVRKQILTGQRLFPFRGWKPGRGGLPKVPGFEGIGRGETTFLDVLDRRGYLTGYVTDNPHLLRPAFASFRRRVDAVTLVHGQVPGYRQKRRPVSNARLRRHLAPELRGGDRGRVREHLGYNGASRREQDYLTARVFRGGMDFLERAAFRRQPFALVVDCFDVHEPWDPPDSYLARYARIKRGGYRPIMPFGTPAGRAGDLSKRTLKLAQALYAAEVTFLDAWLGRFLTRLDDLGLSNTWVVVVSDHGVFLGEHGWIGKQAGAMHGELLDVPFIVRHPAHVGAGRRSGYFASAHDVAPTVLRGVGAPVPKAMDGADLGPLLRGRPARRRPVWTSAWSSTLMAGDGRWLYTAENDSRRIVTEGLYDTRRDPREYRNLARRRPDLVRKFRGELAKAAGKGGFPRL
ncbi:MAG: sulfatase [Solirubrobacterales bacterium]|nr:sulfatase [Solirubrobacterales bacterium]